MSDVANLVEAPTLDVPVSRTLEEQFIGIWPRIQDRVNAALQARANDRSTALENVVRDREKNEAAAIRNVLGELEATIRRELHQPEILQLDLFTDPDDKDQAERDRNALEDRLARIPGELEQELAALARRYERTEPRLFPVAVTWYVPRSIALRTRG